MAYSGDARILLELQALIDNSIGAAAFEQAIACVQAVSPPIQDLIPVKDLPSYFLWLEKYLNWIPSEGPGGTEIYQFLCAFNYVLNQPSLACFQSPETPQPPPYPATISPLSQWMVDFAQQLGKNLSLPNTVTEKTLQSFINIPKCTPEAGLKHAPGYRISDYGYPSGITDWTQATFNQFFAREFLNIDSQRPIYQPDDDTEIVNAADSAFDNSWNIASDSTVTFKSPEDDVQIKTLTWNIGELLAGSKYADAFAGGVFMHAFLGPGDYHRQHAPVSGTIKEACVRHGNVYLELILGKTSDGLSRLIPRRKIIHAKKDLIKADPAATKLDAPDNPGYQFCQSKRHSCSSLFLHP